MPDVFFSSALLPAGWASDVRLSLSGDGTIVGVEVGSPALDAERVPGVALPGVPDLHGHAFQRALAGLTERGAPGGDTFWSWRERMYAFLSRLSPEDVQAVAAQLQVELLRHGYTAAAEFHYLRNRPDGGAYEDPVEMARRILAAAETSGIGLTLLPTVYRPYDFGDIPADEGQRRFVTEVEDLLGDVAVLTAVTAESPDVRVGLALHSLRAVPPAELEEALDGLARIEPTAPVHIHAAEQQREVQACLAWSGARPVEWLLGNAPVDARWCVVHATHMTPAETRALAQSGAVAGLCPTTEANLGDGLFPFADYLSAGGRWGVGSDAHMSVSPVAELRLLEYGQRLVRSERNVAALERDASTARVLLEGAWEGGARACGRPLGRIAAGARADLVVLDPDHPALAGREGDALLDAWIFSGEDTPVRHVMVSGRWVVVDGHHPREEEAAEAYRTVARALSGS